MKRILRRKSLPKEVLCCDENISPDTPSIYSTPDGKYLRDSGSLSESPSDDAIYGTPGSHGSPLQMVGNALSPIEDNSMQESPFLGEPRRRSKRLSAQKEELRESISGSVQNLASIAPKQERFKSPSLFSRKRKRKDAPQPDDDQISVNSVASMDVPHQEPTGKKRKSLAKMSSFSELFSPVKSLRRVTLAMQRSISFISPSKQGIQQYKKPAPTPTKRRPSRLWSETCETNVRDLFSPKQIERQNAIFELYSEEDNMVEDLRLVQKIYYGGLKTLGLLSKEELNQIFGTLDELLPLHEELLGMLRAQRLPNGATDQIGYAMVQWIPTIRNAYITYCGQLIQSKALLDSKRNEAAMKDFLQRCLESPFSRKLDLWNFLDVPRSRLMKYPIMLKKIQDLTPSEHEDIKLLAQAVKAAECIIEEVDEAAGQSKCKFIIDRFAYLEESLKHELIEKQTVLLCSGELKSNRGYKVQAFLFADVFVLSRPATRGGHLTYQVSQSPIPMSELLFEDVPDGTKMGSFNGSFKKAFGQTVAKNMFRILSAPREKGSSHTLQAQDEHDKKQWILVLKKAAQLVDSCTLENGKK